MKKDVLRNLALATQLGMTMGLISAATIVMGLVLGSWVDRQLGTRPYAMLLFILLGVVAGWLGMISLAFSTARRIRQALDQTPGAPVRSAYALADLTHALLLVVELLAAALLPVGLGLGLGVTLDRVLGSLPTLTISLTVVGIIVAALAVMAIGKRATRNAGHDS